MAHTNSHSQIHNLRFFVYVNIHKKNIFQMYIESITSIFKDDQRCVKFLRLKQ